MKRTFYSLFMAFLFGMTGTQVWADDLTTTEIDGVSYYVINNGEEFKMFADLVSNGEFGANAVLKTDISLADVITEGSPWNPIGTSGGIYTGTFDGQGHSITGFNATSEADGGGLFGFATGATIKDFSIAGTLTATAGTGTGVVGYPSNCTITNIHSSLAIVVPVGDVHHVGGVVGSARGGNTISGCTFRGTMDVAAGSTDNFAGIVAYLGGDSVSFCANYGTITFDDAGCAAGGIAGYLNNTGSYVQNCLNMGKVTFSESEGTPTYGGAIVGRLRTHDPNKMTGNCWLEGSATGAGKDGGNPNLTTAFCFNPDMLPTGEVCYKLNGNQSTIGWYQTLGTDEQPVLDATHAQVYMNGRLHCNGDVYEGSTFSNENTEVIQDEHNIVDGFCSYCNLFDKNYLTPNADGFYEIGNAKQLVWFEQLVNTGELSANAVLTADIDFADLMPEGADPEETEVAWTPIGDWGATRGVSSAGYKGHFNGQGHTIKHLNATSKQNYFGVFGVISTDCLIENFDIYGTYHTTFQYAGSVAAYARDDRPTIRNIHSYVDIYNSSAGGRQGGILGGVLTTTFQTVIENCTYSGTLDGNDAGGSGNYGGIVGYVNNNSKTVADITNCLFDGNVVNNNAAPGGCTFGGFVGYSNGGAVTIKNSLSIGHVESAVWGQFFGAVKSTRSSLPNSYYIGEILNGSASTVTLTATETDTDELASGEIAWKLNEETFVDAVWHQTLGDQAYPVPNGNGAIVYQTPSGYECISSDDPNSFADFLNNVIANEKEFLQDIVAYQASVNAYETEIDSWEDIETLEEFLETYKAAAELKEAVKTSAANYAAYQQACEAAATYMEENNLQGETTDILKSYLEDNVEPSEEGYPNGSYAYIMETLNLDDEALAAEVTYLNQLLEAAIAADGIVPGNEITRLVTNPTFTEGDGFEGWTTEVADGGALATGGVAEIMKIARGKNGTFDIKQTVSNLPNGIYLMALNGMFLAGGDIYSQYYAGQLYLNNTYNYFMSPSEDLIEVDAAEDGVNCLISEDDPFMEGSDVLGYVPSTFKGCSYAYNAGRYQNFVAAEVTDETLTVGMRSLGTGIDGDWMPFGNLHVIYLGTADEADEKLAEVLEGYSTRAQVIVDFNWESDGEYVMQYPNISEDLKGQLMEAIGAVNDATTGESKMELINIFSDLFNKVHACRKAYIAMQTAANELFEYLGTLDAYGMIPEEEYTKWEAIVLEAQDHYTNGDVTAEEALQIAEKLNNCELVQKPVDGVYQLATVDDVKLFSILVNNGKSDAKAVLTNDIDMTGIDDFQPIGTSTTPYMGEFDGQGHKISNFGKYDAEEGIYSLAFVGDRQGFFGYVKNATIKNFSIDGTFTYEGGTGYGAIGWAEGSTLQNIHSALNIASVSTSHHIGGVCGDMRAGSKAIGCSFSGTITDNHNSHDCLGGIGGYSNENCLYENCANYGTVTYTAANAYAGGICGYVNNDSFVGVINCLNVGTVAMADGATPSYGGAFVGRLRGHANSKFENNHMLEGSAPNTSGENKINANICNAEQLASGEICYKLNGDQSNINWYQTLGADEFPMLYDTHKVVYVDSNGNYTNEETHTGTGTQDDPFVVKSAADLSNLINLLVSGRMNYVVMEEDVDMAGVTDWTPLFNIADQSNGYPFIDFDGKGHVISNLTSNTEGAYDYCGLFGILCGNVRNLGVENADVTCAGGTGILAGYLGHSTFGQPCYVENVWVTGKVTANGYCGGMFGNVACESHIKNCYANVEVNGSGDLTGGIIGRVRAKIDMTQVYAAGSINRGGGIIGGGFQDATPAGTYNRVAVWNNTNNNFCPARESEELSSIIYYDGTNFADMQTQVVAWDPTVWSCDMEPGSYPVLAAFDPDGIKGVTADYSKQSTEIYNLAGQRLSKMQKGINIVNGKKIMVK